MSARASFSRARRLALRGFVASSLAVVFAAPVSAQTARPAACEARPAPAKPADAPNKCATATTIRCQGASDVFETDREDCVIVAPEHACKTWGYTDGQVIDPAHPGKPMISKSPTRREVIADCLMRHEFVHTAQGVMPIWELEEPGYKTAFDCFKAYYDKHCPDKGGSADMCQSSLANYWLGYLGVGFMKCLGGATGTCSSCQNECVRAADAAKNPKVTNACARLKNLYCDDRDTWRGDPEKRR